MELVKLCAYKRRHNGLFCNSSAYAHTSAHLPGVALRLYCDVCTSGAAWAAGVLNTGIYVRLLAGAAWAAGV
jgi:hypothetical protein